jgi:hypothetical protein
VARNVFPELDQRDERSFAGEGQLDIGRVVARKTANAAVVVRRAGEQVEVVRVRRYGLTARRRHLADHNRESLEGRTDRVDVFYWRVHDVCS